MASGPFLSFPASRPWCWTSPFLLVYVMVYYLWSAVLGGRSAGAASILWRLLHYGGCRANLNKGFFLPPLLPFALSNQISSISFVFSVLWFDSSTSSSFLFSPSLSYFQVSTWICLFYFSFWLESLQICLLMLGICLCSSLQLCFPCHLIMLCNN